MGLAACHLRETNTYTPLVLITPDISSSPNGLLPRCCPTVADVGLKSPYADEQQGHL